MFRIWLRSLTRYKLYTFVNISGLSLGICAVVAIFIYVADELSFDRFHANADRIYLVNESNKFGDETTWPTTAAPLGEAIRNDLTNAEAVTRIFGRQASIQLNDKDASKFREDYVWFADADVFKVLTFEFIAGDPRTALSQPDRIVLNRTTAERYFGKASDALGKDVLFEGRIPMTVSGVFEDVPSNATLQTRVIANFENFYTMETPEVQDYLRKDWVYNPVQTFLLLKEGVAPNEFEKELEAVKNRYADDRVKQHTTYYLQPITSIRLHSSFTYDGAPGINNIYVLASIGFIILIIACVNFINLANVHSLKRAKEIGIRKVLGAQKKGLITQFLAESGALVLIAFGIGILSLYILLPYINTLSGKTFSLGDLIAWKILGGIASLFVITSLLSGTYPAFYITRFNPVIVLKGLTGSKTSEGYMLRKILMTTQFTISIVLVVLSIVFFQQMKFIGNKPLGFQTNNIITAPIFSMTPNSILGSGVDGPLRARMNAFENELLKHAGIQAVTASALPPGAGFSTNALTTTDKIKETDNMMVATMAVDYDFIETYKMEVIAGRGFSKEAGTDHLQAFIINEQAVRTLGWETPIDAIGQRLGCLGKDGTVVGVVKDFHFQGLQNALSPIILEVAASKFNVFSVSFAGGNSLNSMIEVVRSEWNKAFPEKVFEFRFLDETLQNNYSNEQRMVSMMQVFSILAILISGLGLFGLAAYVNHQRSKEVSIRKVLGANAGQVFVVLSREFVKMSLIAFLIAIPFAYFLAGEWLNTFAYRTSVGIVAFAVAGIIAIATVLITISYETIKSARINPVDTLRE
ncbi:MAG TPA: ABC transporter permease [Cyclobacteriaceae bacterium]|nr:ABC transporter permease [Cyclobacteriaceae bacterium]